MAKLFHFALLCPALALAVVPHPVQAEGADGPDRPRPAPTRSDVVTVASTPGPGGTAVLTATHSRGVPTRVTKEGDRTRVFITGTEGGNGGVVVLSAHNGGRCVLGEFAPAGSEYVIDVRCAADTGFALLRTRVYDRRAVTAPLAYGYFPFGSAATQTALRAYAFNSGSASELPRAVRSSPGSYRVEIPSMGSADSSGNVIVSSAQTDVNVSCRASLFGADESGALTFNVGCFAAAGPLATPTPADSAFTFMFTRGSNAAGSRSGEQQAWASGVAASEVGWPSSSSGSLPTRSGDTVSLPRHATGGAFFVTGHSGLCQVQTPPLSPFGYRVRCERGASKYYFLYLR